MSKLMIVKQFGFEAAHRLPNYQGPCNRVHGHSYKLEVGVSGPVDIDSGMIMDFKVLKSIVKTKIIDKMDHFYLNNIDVDGPKRPFPSHNPTAENMVRWIVEVLDQAFKAIGPHLELVLVRLWETSGSRCEWRA